MICVYKRVWLIIVFSITGQIGIEEWNMANIDLRIIVSLITSAEDELFKWNVMIFIHPGDYKSIPHMAYNITSITDFCCRWSLTFRHISNSRGDFNFSLELVDYKKKRILSISIYSQFDRLEYYISVLQSKYKLHHNYIFSFLHLSIIYSFICIAILN